MMALALAALAACGSSKSSAPTTPQSPNGGGQVPWHDEPIVMRPQAMAPFISPGERMTFNANIHGIDIATFGLAAGDLTEVSGKKVVVVQAGVQSSKMLSILKKIDDTFTTWIDVQTGRPVVFKGHELAGLDDPTIEDTTVDFTTAGTGQVKVALERPDTGHADETQENTKDDLLDFQSFFLAMRAWDAPVGASLTADVLRSRYMWRTQLAVGGYENLVTQLGSLPTVRYDGVSRRLTRKGEIDMSQGDRHYSIWISDDADRVPLLMVAKTDYGDVRMEIIDYAAGQGQRLGQTWGGGKHAPAKP
jgi:Protein of unknown function (DUF3108)